MSDAPRKPPRLANPGEPLGPPEPEPPPREFGFKPAEFERANQPAGTAPVDVRELYRSAATPPASAPAPASAENDVHAILRANAAAEAAKGLNQVVPRARRPSRRKRDFWLLLIGGNLAVGGLTGVLHRNVVTLVFGCSAMIFCSLALIWIMWFVLDDY